MLSSERAVTEGPIVEDHIVSYIRCIISFISGHRGPHSITQLAQRAMQRSDLPLEEGRHRLARRQRLQQNLPRGARRIPNRLRAIPSGCERSQSGWISTGWVAAAPVAAGGSGGGGSQQSASSSRQQRQQSTASSQRAGAAGAPAARVRRCARRPRRERRASPPPDPVSWQLIPTVQLTGQPGVFR